MKISVLLRVLIISGGVAVIASQRAAVAADPAPLWAWGMPAAQPNPVAAGSPSPGASGAPTAPDAVKKLSIPGSKFQFTAAEVAARFSPADWFPEDHETMPEIVARGREAAKPPIWACAFCHMPNGKGRPENANLTGLPYEYFVQQMLDYKEGRRATLDPRRPNNMALFAQSMTRDEIEAAARYFSAIPTTPWVKVIESDTAPKTVARNGVYLTITGVEAGTEPLGNRIIETPLSAQDFELRHPRSGFVAYVPKGSLKRGEELVTTGAGKTTPCTVCHGLDLKGLGPVPPLAGRSPSYTMRQLYDMQHGNRVGAWSPLMALSLSNLTNDDLLVAAAYVASLDP